MFKSIEYKLILFLLLLIGAVGGAVYCFMEAAYWSAGISVLLVLIALRYLFKHYNRFNQNILFLLNALDNGDYSFHFTETKISRREKELNRMLNRIKDILTRTRKEIIENENFLSLIIESVTTGVIILNQHDHIISVNASAHQLLGLPVFTHLNQLRALGETFPQVFKNLQAGNQTQVKISNEREEIQLSLRASSIHMQGKTIRVITLNNIENELEAKEVESWTKLIRVMTHEIMNSIAPITSLSETLLTSFKLKQSEAGHEDLNRNTVEALETIRTTAKGLVSFVESYRKFTGIPTPVFKQVELTDLLTKVLRLEEEAIKMKGIEVCFSPHAPLVCDVDEVQISQVLVNLIKNAVEAIEPGEGGIIRIDAAASNHSLLIEIADNGKPIPADVAPHIFVPFFTTKASGTGIGLSVSRYIIRLHGGNLRHRYANGLTTFSINLPMK